MKQSPCRPGDCFAHRPAFGAGKSARSDTISQNLRGCDSFSRVILYLLTTLLFAFVALFAAADASLVSLDLVNAFSALRWVRVHFITLGILSQVSFGLLPVLVASLSKKPKPAFRWDIWLTLNVGLVTFVPQPVLSTFCTTPPAEQARGMRR